MTKAQFLESLRRHLSPLPPSDVDEIIRDQEEYIREAVSSGRAEEQVVDSLGDPKAFAAGLTAEMNAEMKIEQAAEQQNLKSQVRSTFGAVLAVLALAPFNLIFVFGPFMGLVGITIGGWAVAGTLIVLSGVALTTYFMKFITVSAGLWMNLSALFFVLGAAGAGILAFLFMYQMTKIFSTLTISYLRWNLNFIKGRA
jgi:uncharacterized membrane protein